LLVLKTWFGPWRQEWREAAMELYDRFQSPARVLGFSVGGLSFLMADMRLDRTSDRARLQSSDDHARVSDWCRRISAAAMPRPGWG
jgi:hypothetical protein